MQIFREIQKIEPLEDGTIRAYGFASAPVRDAHGEIVTAEAMRSAIEDYMKFPAVREQHDPQKAAGVGLDISLDGEDKTQFVAHVVDKAAVEKVKAGVYRGFSIGGRIKRRNPKDTSIIQEIELMEISLVDRPSCPAATLDLWKRDSSIDDAHRDLWNSVQAEYEALGKGSGAGGDEPSGDYDEASGWDDGFNEIKPNMPTSVADGGPYRSSVPRKGADQGVASMPTDPNSGKSPVGAGQPNATRDTGGGSGGSSGGDYFSGAKPSDLQALFEKISELVASAKPPVDLAQAVTKRTYSEDQRRAAAASGAAMKDGAFPILNKADLAQAISGVEKLKDPPRAAVAKAHIIGRARALDATAMLPNEWISKGKPDPKPDPAPESDAGKAIAKSGDLLQSTLASLERLEVRTRRGKATPEAYRLAKAYKEMEVDALAEVLAADAINKIAANDSRVSEAETLAKQLKADKDDLLKQLSDTNKGLEVLAARLQKLEEQPMPPKTAGSIYAERGGEANTRAFSADAIAKAKADFEDMTEEERALLLTKVALSHPRKMNLNPIASPPRSIGGTAGRDDLR